MDKQYEQRIIEYLIDDNNYLPGHKEVVVSIREDIWELVNAVYEKHQYEKQHYAAQEGESDNADAYILKLSECVNRQAQELHKLRKLTAQEGESDFVDVGDGWIQCLTCASVIPLDDTARTETDNQITKRKIYECASELGYDTTTQMPASEVLKWLDQQDGGR